VAKRNVEEQIERLGAARSAPRTEAVAALRRGLADRVNLVVAKAAKVAAEAQLEELLPDLLRAFERLFDNAAVRDPQCWGKTAIAKALLELGHRESAPFVRGARHTQMEAVWGGREDTAAALRGVCLLALPACTDLRREDVLRRIVDALTEPAAPVRAEAVRALEEMGGPEPPLLLRLKASTGDREARVTGQVFDSLLKLEGVAALEFVGQFPFDGADELREEAALAMGASRLPGAMDRLKSAWHDSEDAWFRAVLLRAIGISPEPEAIAFLLVVLRNGSPRDRSNALEALKIHGGSPEIRKMIEEALDEGKATH
jgi:HEAT repeat protein